MHRSVSALMLNFVVVWQDVDLIECEVEARSDTFAASARLYFTSGTLRELANAFAGFPRNLADRRYFETKNSEGGNTMTIQIDGSGILVQIHDVEDTDQWAGVRVSAEAAAIDRT